MNPSFDSDHSTPPFVISFRRLGHKTTQTLHLELDEAAGTPHVQCLADEEVRIAISPADREIRSAPRNTGQPVATSRLGLQPRFVDNMQLYFVCEVGSDIPRFGNLPYARRKISRTSRPGSSAYHISAEGGVGGSRGLGVVWQQEGILKTEGLLGTRQSAVGDSPRDLHSPRCPHQPGKKECTKHVREHDQTDKSMIVCLCCNATLLCCFAALWRVVFYTKHESAETKQSESLDNRHWWSRPSGYLDRQ